MLVDVISGFGIFACGWVLSKWMRAARVLVRDDHDEAPDLFTEITFMPTSDGNRYIERMPGEAPYLVSKQKLSDEEAARLEKVWRRQEWPYDAMGSDE